VGIKIEIRIFFWFKGEIEKKIKFNKRKKNKNKKNKDQIEKNNIWQIIIEWWNWKQIKFLQNGQDKNLKSKE
jgi:hypothetical protein